MHHFTQPIPIRPEEIELLRSDLRGTISKKDQKRLEKLLPSPPDTTDAFIIKSAGDWLVYNDQQKPSEKLFGDFWFENELAILYADTNAGKSILAVQLGEAIAGGYPIEGFEMPRKLPVPNTVGGQNVLYFDFELSAEQFSRRYTDHAHGHYRFPNNFYRVVLNPNAKGEHKFKLFADYLENALENFLITTGARVIIIDNLTCLRSGTEAAAGAIRLMRSLRNMRQRYRLSILVLAHTPKRKPGMPLTGNDLGGSKMLLNFADSAFAIGQSEVKPGLSYLIQVKQRNASRQYGPENVCLCRLVKPANFIKFQFEGQDIESRHLLTQKQQQLRDTETHLLSLRNEGKSFRQIAAETGIPHSTVASRLKSIMQVAETEAPPMQPAATEAIIPSIAESQPKISQPPLCDLPPEAPPSPAEPVIQNEGDTATATPPQAAVMPQPENEQEAIPAENPPGPCRSTIIEIPIVMEPPDLMPDDNWRPPYARRNRGG